MTCITLSYLSTLLHERGVNAKDIEIVSDTALTHVSPHTIEDSGDSDDDYDDYYSDDDSDYDYDDDCYSDDDNGDCTVYGALLEDLCRDRFASNGMSKLSTPSSGHGKILPFMPQRRPSGSNLMIPSDNPCSSRWQSAPGNQLDLDCAVWKQISQRMTQAQRVTATSGIVSRAA